MAEDTDINIQYSAAGVHFDAAPAVIMNKVVEY
jgi:hypothetical protein